MNGTSSSSTAVTTSSCVRPAIARPARRGRSLLTARRPRARAERSVTTGSSLGVERELDEFFATTLRRQPDGVARRAHVETKAFAGERGRHEVKGRHRDVGQDLLPDARRGIFSFAALGDPAASLVDGAP